MQHDIALQFSDAIASAIDDGTLTVAEDTSSESKQVNTTHIPSDAAIHSWIQHTLSHQLPDADKAHSVTIRLVCPQESQSLNLQYRGKDYPTNVLSFGSDLPDFVAISPKPLGDLVLCVDVVLNESRDQQKPVLDHWAHLIIHGCLHLLGYDHQDDTEAEEMEALEVKLLGDINIKNPYIYP